MHAPSTSKLGKRKTRKTLPRLSDNGRPEQAAARKQKTGERDAKRSKQRQPDDPGAERTNQESSLRLASLESAVMAGLDSALASDLFDLDYESALVQKHCKSLKFLGPRCNPAAAELAIGRIRARLAVLAQRQHAQLGEVRAKKAVFEAPAEDVPYLYLLPAARAADLVHEGDVASLLSFAHAKVTTPRLQADLLLDGLGPSAEYREAMTTWMAEQTRVLSTRLGDRQRAALASYCGLNFADAWDEYARTRGALDGPVSPDGHGDAPRRSWVLDLDGCWKLEGLPCLPRGARLFEGQGKHEDDLLASLADGSLAVGSAVVRYRPSSTTWVPNVGLNFLGATSLPAHPDRYEKPFRHLKAPDSPTPWAYGDRIRREAIRLGDYRTPGCLIVHDIVDEDMAAIFRQGMPGAIFTEAEIILRPCVRMTVARIERGVYLPVRSLGRPACPTDPVCCDIIWVNTVSLPRSDIGSDIPATGDTK